MKRKYQYLMYLIGAWFLDRAGDPFESIDWTD